MAIIKANCLILIDIHIIILAWICLLLIRQVILILIKLLKQKSNNNSLNLIKYIYLILSPNL